MTIAFIIYRIYKTIFYNTVSIVKSQMYLYNGHTEEIVLLIYE